LAAIKLKIRTGKNIRHLRILLSRTATPAIRTLIREALDRIVPVVMRLPASNKLIKLHSTIAERNFL
jgi:hypothetical protein